MGSMIFFELLKGVILILLVDLLGGQSREKIISIKSFITIIIIASLYYLSNLDGWNWFRNILPVAIMSVMALHVLLIGIGYDLKRYAKIIISAYIITIMMCFALGVLGGVILWLLKRYFYFPYQNEGICFFGVIIITIIWLKYDSLQKYTEDIVLNISVIVGAFVLFFQQFFQIAVVEKD